MGGLLHVCHSLDRICMSSQLSACSVFIISFMERCLFLIYIGALLQHNDVDVAITILAFKTFTCCFCDVMDYTVGVSTYCKMKKIETRHLRTEKGNKLCVKRDHKE